MLSLLHKRNLFNVVIGCSLEGLFLQLPAEKKAPPRFPSLSALVVHIGGLPCGAARRRRAPQAFYAKKKQKGLPTALDTEALSAGGGLERLEAAAVRERKDSLVARKGASSGLNPGFSPVKRVRTLPPSAPCRCSPCDARRAPALRIRATAG